MKKKGAILLTFSAGAMALVWRLAVANYISLAAFHRPYPLPEAMLALGLAALTCAATRRRGLRVITVISLHGVGLALAVLRTVYVYQAGPHPFVPFGWISRWLATGPDINAWSAVLLQAALATGFWGGGWYLIRRSGRLQSHYARLDIGLAAFFVLFLTKLLLQHKSGIEIQDFLSEKLLISFMVFGLLTIAVARHRGTAQARFVSGKKIIGMTLSAAVAVVLFSTGLLVFFLPYMTAAAEAGHAALKTASGPVKSVLIAILRFMYGPRHADQTLGPVRHKPPPTASGEAMGDGSWWVDLLEQVFVYAAIGVGTLLLLAAGIALAWLVVRWLWRRTPNDGDNDRNTDGMAAFRAWIETLALALASLWKKLSRRFVRLPGTGAAFFAALLRWGRRSGMPVRASETPLEYGRRLQAGFPMAAPEIATIVDLFNREKYGEQVLDCRSLDLASASWRKLRSPLHWGRRLRTWFVQQGDHA